MFSCGKNIPTVEAQHYCNPPVLPGTLRPSGQHAPASEPKAKERCPGGSERGMFSGCKFRPVVSRQRIVPPSHTKHHIRKYHMLGSATYFTSASVNVGQCLSACDVCGLVLLLHLRIEQCACISRGTLPSLRFVSQQK